MRHQKIMHKEKTLAECRRFWYINGGNAGIAQLVERNLAKVEVAGPSPVSRSVSRMHSNQRHS
jgi:hypothetical protein